MEACARKLLSFARCDRDPGVVVENACRYTTEICEGANVPFEKCLWRLRRKRDDEAVVRVRQVHGQAVHLLFHSGDDHQRFAEVPGADHVQGRLAAGLIERAGNTLPSMAITPCNCSANCAINR